MKENVLLGMSGGVDSSAAACLLKEQGYDVAGITFRLWDKNFGIPNSDISDAKLVCDKLSIPHFTVDLREDFKTNVVDRFISEYLAGRTPNPCIFCNRFIKFAAFARIADELGYQFISTGHYARKGYNVETKRYELFRCTQRDKDQSYVLYSISQKQLARILFPLSDYTKKEIREIAEKYSLPVAQKPDSQDICFVPNGKHTAFIESYTQKKGTIGNFVDTQHRILGQNKGIDAYTIGQRKGLGISLGKPMFVSEIIPATGDVVLVDDERLLFKDTIIAKDINWVSFAPTVDILKADVQIRYSHIATPATIIPQQEGTQACIQFQTAQRAPTKGQAIVAYIDNKVIFGGTIA